MRLRRLAPLSAVILWWRGRRTAADASCRRLSNGPAQNCVPGTRHFGNEGRDSLRGPTFKQWDLAIYKNTQITERIGVQLRADFFNFLNHPNFSNPSAACLHC